jgi:hypothetical protein
MLNGIFSKSRESGVTPHPALLIAYAKSIASQTENYYVQGHKEWIHI